MRSIRIRTGFDIVGKGYKTLTGGDRVRFDVEETLRGPEAKNIKKINAGENRKH